MTTALNVSLNTPTSPSLPTDSRTIVDASDIDLTGTEQKTVDVASTATISSDANTGIGQFTLFQTSNGNDNESDVIDDAGIVSATPPPPGVVDDFLPSCDDVIQHLLQFAEEDHGTDVGTPESVPPKQLPPAAIAAKSETEISKTTVVSTSAATTPTVLSLQPSMPDNQTPGATGEGMQQSRMADAAGNATAVPIGGVSSVRLPVAPSHGEVPVVYLLATPGIRSATGAGAAMQQAGSGIVPSSASRASFTVVSRAAVGASAVANGDVRPLLR
jgi:hypothetical protein